MNKADITGGSCREQTRRDLGLAAHRAFLTAAAAAAAMLSASTLLATSGTWISTSSTDWADGANWNPAAAPTGTETATFKGGSKQLTILPESGRTVGWINFDQVALNDAGSYTIGVTNGNALTLAQSGGTGTVSMPSSLTTANVTETFAAPLVLLYSYQFSNNSPAASTVMVIAGGVTSGAASGTTDFQLKGSNTGANTVSGVVANGSSGAAVSLTKLGSGSWTVSNNNTFTGKTTIGQGILSVGSLNYVTSGTWAGHLTGSNLGMPSTTAAGTIGLGSDQAVSPFTPYTGQLKYTGAGETTDRVINLAGKQGGGIIEQAGTGLLKFTANLTATGSGIKTLTLQGSTAGTGEIAGSIRDNSSVNKTSLEKAGSGTWTLSGANIYTGGTTVSAGSLVISGAGNINTSSGVLVAAGATLTNNSSVAYTKALTLAEGATLSGSGAFTPSSATITGDLSSASFTTFGLGSTAFAKAGNLELTLSNITEGTYTLFSGSGLSGTFATMTIGGVPLTSAGSGNFTGSLGNASYTFTNASNELIVVIPEPATMALMALGLTTGVALGRRRRA